MEILTECNVVTILQIETILHPFGLDPFPVRAMMALELRLVFSLLASIDSLLEKIIP